MVLTAVCGCVYWVQAANTGGEIPHGGFVPNPTGQWENSNQGSLITMFDTKCFLPDGVWCVLLEYHTVCIWPAFGVDCSSWNTPQGRADGRNDQGRPAARAVPRAAARGARRRERDHPVPSADNGRNQRDAM